MTKDEEPKTRSMQIRAEVQLSPANIAEILKAKCLTCDSNKWDEMVTALKNAAVLHSNGLPASSGAGNYWGAVRTSR